LTGNYPDGFLEGAGAPGLPAVNPVGHEDAGDDGFRDPLSNQVDPQPLVVDDEDPEDEGLPQQGPRPVPPPARRPPARQVQPPPIGPASPPLVVPSNPRLAASINQATQQLINLTMEDDFEAASPYVLGVLDFHCIAINTVDMHANAVQNGLGIIALLAPGVDLKSIKMKINDDRQSYSVTAQGVHELNHAINMIPGQERFGELNGPRLWEAVRQSIQLYLNSLNRNAAGRVDFNTDGQFPVKCTAEKLVKPSKMGINIGLNLAQSLAMEENGDRYLLHKMSVRSQERNTYTTTYLAIGFALEDMGTQNELPEGEIFRVLPESPRVAFRDGASAGGGTAAGGTATGQDASPRSNRRRRTDENGNAIGLGDGDTTIPDAATSTGMFGGFFRS